MKVLVIGNPVSGGGKAARRIEVLERALAALGCNVEVFLTQKAGDGRQRAAALDGDVDRLVVAGGDGTLNEVLNGLADPGSTAIAQLPVGTANLLKHDFNLPRRPEQVARLVVEGQVRRLDMGLAGDRRFLSLVSCGYDAMVIAEIHQRRKQRLGFRGYIVPMLAAAWRYREQPMRVIIDEKRQVSGAAVVISNRRCYGGLWSVTDRAECDSGQFDICVFPRGSRLAIARYFTAALFRRVSRLKDVAYLHGRTVRVEADHPVTAELDGEPIGTTPLEVTIQPRVVPFVVPDDALHSRKGGMP
jgi:YegS/Rv2252/BmrU family lipid kinase